MPNDVDICVNKVLTRYLVLQKGFFRGPRNNSRRELCGV